MAATVGRARACTTRSSAPTCRERTLYHGHSYSGNALAAAVALRHLELIDEWDVLANVRRRAPTSSARCSATRIAPLPAVGEVRRRGLMTGIELAPPADGLRWGRRVSAACVRRGVLIRPLGDVIVLMPPLTVTAGRDRAHRRRRSAASIDEVCGVTRRWSRLVADRSRLDAIARRRPLALDPHARRRRSRRSTLDDGRTGRVVRVERLPRPEPAPGGDRGRARRPRPMGHRSGLGPAHRRRPARAPRARGASWPSGRAPRRALLFPTGFAANLGRAHDVRQPTACCIVQRRAEPRVDHRRLPPGRGPRSRSPATATSTTSTRCSRAARRARRSSSPTPCSRWTATSRRSTSSSRLRRGTARCSCSTRPTPCSVPPLPTARRRGRPSCASARCRRRSARSAASSPARERSSTSSSTRPGRSSSPPRRRPADTAAALAALARRALAPRATRSSARLRAPRRPDRAGPPVADRPRRARRRAPRRSTRRARCSTTTACSSPPSGRRPVAAGHRRGCASRCPPRTPTTRSSGRWPRRSPTLVIEPCARRAVVGTGHRGRQDVGRCRGARTAARPTACTVAARKPVQSFDADDADPTDADVLAAATGEAPARRCAPRHRWYGVRDGAADGRRRARPRAVHPRRPAGRARSGPSPEPAVRWVETVGGPRSPDRLRRRLGRPVRRARPRSRRARRRRRPRHHQRGPALGGSARRPPRRRRAQPLRPRRRPPRAQPRVAHRPRRDRSRHVLANAADASPGAPRASAVASERSSAAGAHEHHLEARRSARCSARRRARRTRAAASTRCTGISVSSAMRRSRPRSMPPPPTRCMPRTMRSWASSGGACAEAARSTESTIG